jgi:putative DNA primase/helicase
MADVPADAAHGLFDELHGLPSGAALADAINRAAREHYGTAGREYLKALVAADLDTVRAGVKAIQADFAREHLPAGADGQAVRVAERFALIAAGGELASSLGVTGWPAGEAVRGLGVCFRAWLERRGGAGSREDAEALAQVRHFIEAHGEARFTDLAATHDRPTINRAGYRRRIDGRVEHLVLTEVFRREVCAGLDYQRVARVLRAAGVLRTESSDHFTIKVRGAGRVYCLTGDTDAD